MAVAIGITSSKGGVGTSTVCANVAVGMARRGRKTCLVDACFGTMGVGFILGAEEFTAFNLIDCMDDYTEIADVTVECSEYENLSIINASRLYTVGSVNVNKLARIIDKIKDDYDCVFIDIPYEYLKNSYIMSVLDKVAVVTTLSELSVRCADSLINSHMVGKADVSLIINRIVPELVAYGKMMTVDDALERTGCKLLGLIPEECEINILTEQSICIADDTRFKSAKAIDNIIRRILGEHVSAINFEYETPYIRNKKLLKN